MRESASTDLREPQGSNPLGPPGPELLNGNTAEPGGLPGPATYPATLSQVSTFPP